MTWKEFVIHFKSILDNILATPFVILISFFIGRWSAINRRIGMYRRVTTANKDAFKATSLLSVSGSRFELTKRQIIFNIEKDVFKLPFPEEKLIAMREASPAFLFDDAESSNRVHVARNDAKRLIPDLDNILALSAIEIAGEFVERARRQERLFNGHLFHALSISSSATRSQDEEPIVTINLFTTNYFTHQVVHRAFKKAVLQADLGDSLSRGQIQDGLRFFMNGFGLNCLVALTDNRLSKEFVLLFGRRSQRVAKNAATGTWHVPANEALSQTDVEDQGISIDRWIRRALHEEVGISENQILSTYIFNVFIGVEEMQPGMGCLVLCEGKIQNIVSRIAGSQDGLIEYDAYTTLPLEDASIEESLAKGGLFCEGKRLPFSPSADSILRNIVARRAESFLR